MSPPEPAPAEKFPEFAGFEVLQELGRSPKGTIYKARRLIERDIVALKVFRASACDRQFLEQLPANAEASFFLGHKGLVRALGCSLSGDTPMLVSEFASGEAVARTLADGCGFETAQALRMALDCAEALRYAAAHGRFHGRLHPADMIFGKARTRITGVGLGERPEPSSSPGEPYLFDPLSYTAPEAMPDRNPADTSESRVAADVYSLGAILLHVLTGRPPSTEADRAHAMERMLPAVRRLLDRILTPDPAARLDYDALIAALTQTLQTVEPAEPQARERLAPEPSKPVAGDLLAPALAPALAHGTEERPASKGASPKAEDLPLPKSAPRFRRAALMGLAALALLTTLGFVALRLLRSPERTGDGPQENVSGLAAHSRSDQPTATIQAPGETSAASGERSAVEPMDPAQPVDPVPAPEEDSTQKPPARPDDDYALATRQLTALQDLLRRGEIKYSPALLRAVRTVSERAGLKTPTGVRAQKFASEIEQRLAKKGGGKE